MAETVVSSLNHLLFLAPENILSLRLVARIVAMSCSHVFVKKLDLIPKEKLEFTSWRRTYKKLDQICPCFDQVIRAQAEQGLTFVKSLTLSTWSLISR